jgi:NAD(P)-dependent dehydrogenase (short-subunit alcohol dehydrogenase family)
MDLGLRGKKAIVTGATKGIARGVVELLLAEGADVAFCARTADEVAEAVAQLKKPGSNVFGEALSVRDGEALRGWLERSVAALGGCDIFIPAVSGGGGMDSEKNWVRNFEIDMLHTVRGCEALMPHLQKSESGSIVIIASTNAVETFAAPMAYNAIKAGLVTYAKQLSQFVGKHAVRVNAVSPGPIYFEGGPWDRIRQHAPAVLADAEAHCVIGRLGRPEDVAAAVVFLASPVSGFTVGQNLHVDGGYMEHIAF